MYIKFYPVVLSRRVQRVLYFHTGFDDRSLIWIVDGKVYDLFFFKIK